MAAVSAAIAPRSLAGLGQHQHACCTFSDLSVQRAVVSRFAVEAITRGERLICFTERREQFRVSGWLKAAGLDVQRLIASGPIELRCYSGDPRNFDPSAAVASVVAETDRAVTDGYTGLAMTGSISAEIADSIDIDQVVAYESALAPIFAASPVVGLCQYDRRVLPKDVVDRLVEPHRTQIDLSGDRAVVAHDGFTIAELPTGELVLAGEVDISVEDLLRSRMREHIFGQGDLVLDVGGVSFIDATGCRVLFELARAIAPRRLILSQPSPAVARALSLCGWIGHPSIVVDIGSCHAVSGAS